MTTKCRSEQKTSWEFTQTPWPGSNTFIVKYFLDLKYDSFLCNCWKLLRSSLIDIASVKKLNCFISAWFILCKIYPSLGNNFWIGMITMSMEWSFYRKEQMPCHKILPKIGLSGDKNYDLNKPDCFYWGLQRTNPHSTECGNVGFIMRRWKLVNIKGPTQKKTWIGSYFYHFISLLSWEGKLETKLLDQFTKIIT